MRFAWRRSELPCQGLGFISTALFCRESIQVDADDIVGFKFVGNRAVTHAGNHGCQVFALFHKIFGADRVIETLTESDIAELDTTTGYGKKRTVIGITLSPSCPLSHPPADSLSFYLSYLPPVILSPRLHEHIREYPLPRRSEGCQHGVARTCGLSRW